ncbi:hypothetical protein CDCA_CDCA10G2947 [Cyanidium caldarium]|uniref:Uncharacterized protein n=1 Tax=Cyanidium caldarium TaxID=2771 RepID=A0AAV9IXA3_CYACA|nr:hypothetical protein CDCA_CDCA10G2947 [Cyanidium caldarium]|eukprot:ctg_1005.g395
MSSTKTFYRWVNLRLAERELSIPSEGELVREFQDGFFLCELLEILCGGPVPHSPQRVPNRIRALQQVATALQYIHERLPNVKLVNISAEDIVDGNEKLLLALLWALICSEIGNESDWSAKEGLLLWCQQRTTPPVLNFRKSFQDGRALCQIVLSLRPGLEALREYESWRQPAERWHRVIEAAHDELGIPPLIDVSDVVGEDMPDERAIMTYVSQFFRVAAREGQSAKQRSAAALQEHIQLLAQRYEEEGDVAAYYELQSVLWQHRMPAYIPPEGKELPQVLRQQSVRERRRVQAARARHWIEQRRPPETITALLAELDDDEQATTLRNQLEQQQRLDEQRCLLDRLEDEVRTATTHDELERAARQLVACVDSIGACLREQHEAVTQLLSERRQLLQQQDEYESVWAWMRQVLESAQQGRDVDEHEVAPSVAVQARLGDAWQRFLEDVTALREARKVFRKFDRDHDGLLSNHEFRGAAAALGIDVDAAPVPTEGRPPSRPVQAVDLAEFLRRVQGGETMKSSDV